MAEQVRLRNTLTPLRVPRVNFAGAEAQARGLGNLAQSLSRMSNFVSQQAQSAAVVEGAEYGALNAPTRQQIIDATQKNEKIDLVGDQTTVFGKAARKAALEAASDELQFLAKSTITDLTRRAIEDQIPPSALADQIDTAIIGFSSTLDNVSPATARSLRAGLGIYGNAEYEAYTKKFLTDDLAKRKSQFEMNFQLTLDTLPKLLSNGRIVKQKDGSEVSTADTIQGLKQSLMQQAISFNYSRSEIEGLGEQFDREVQDAAKGTVTNYVIESDNPYATYIRIDEDSKALPENVRAALDAMTPEKRREAIKEAREAWHNTIDDETKRVNFKQAKRNDAIQEEERNASRALSFAQSDPDKAIKLYQASIARMRLIDPIKANEMEDKIQTNGQGFVFAMATQDDVELAIDMQISSLDVNLTLSKLDTLLFKRELSYSDWLKYTEVVNTRMDERFRNALIETRKRLELPTGMIADARVLQRWQWNALNKVELELRKAVRDAPDGARDFDAIGWLNDNFEDLTKRTEKNVNDEKLKELSGLTRAGVTRQMNAATPGSDEEASLQRLLDIADELKANNIAVDGF
ncbi:MAG TPA: hypothetical protein DCW74_01575 [Alteromonas australica]|uniref:Uncharacterized protein n=1 Tax=Alteromonas australica TaxID=589873 RepID=A0A350NZD9_9ALTE|nr:hypothetical protein [Alteromonas australica]|tara:strand:+ start:46 stop:1779 length:1734 start_codon:yes stop_codon:yes gene_type:complete